MTGTNCNWTATYTYTIKDGCNNSASNAVVVYSGGDTQAPGWTTTSGSLNRTIECSDAAGLSSAQALVPVASDNCDNTLVPVKTSGVFVPGSCPQAGTYTNTWTVTDDCGKTSALYTQVITIQDNTPPTFQVPGNISVNKDASCGYNVNPSATGSPANLNDNCTNVSDITATYTDSNCFGSANGVNVNAGNGTLIDFNISGFDGQPASAIKNVALSFNTNKGIGHVEITLVAPNGQSLILVGPYCSSGSCVVDGTASYTPVFYSSGYTKWDNLNNPTGPGNYIPYGGISDNSSYIPGFSGYVSSFSNFTGDMNGTWRIFTRKQSNANGTLNFNSVCFTPGCANDQVVVRHWTVTDACGNASTADQVITIKDNTAPVVTTAVGSLNANLQCSDAAGLTAALSLAPAATDNCTAIPKIHTVSDITTPDGSCSNAYVRVRTWNFTDECGNTSANFEQTIKVMDTAAPIVTTVAGSLDAILQCKSSGGLTTALALAPTATDNCTATPAIHLISDVTTPIAGQGSDYNRVRKWNFDDGCGNTSSDFVQTITITDTEKPTITAPIAVTVSSDVGKCTATGVVLGTPVTADNCSVASVTNNAVEPFALGNTTVTWTVTDGSGNSQTATQLVTVTDNQKPTITAPAAVTVSSDEGKCTAIGVVLGTPVTSDNCSVASVTNDAIEPFALGNTTVTWTVTDGSGNTQTATQIITVTDNQKPTITAPAAVTVSSDEGKCTASGVVLGTPVTTDNCTVASVTNNATQPFALGNTTVTWTVTDGSGNTQTTTQMVTVTDNQKPTITAPVAVSVSSDEGKCTASGVVLGTPVTADNCSVASITNNAVEPFALGNTTVTWTVTDGSGNTQTATQVVTVTDSQKPTITAPVVVTVSSDAGKCTASGVTLGTPVTADNCSVASVSNNSTEPFALGNTTVTWTVTDGSGNTQTATQVVTVTDNQKPTITAPAAVSVSSDEGKCTASGVTLGTPVTADNCSVASVTNDAVQPFVLGNNTVTWTVTDGSGNTQTATQVVTITDNQKPTITAPAAVSVSSDEGKCTASGVTLGSPVTGDNCSVASVTSDAVQPFALGNTTVTWTVTDGSGNTQTATQVVTVTDSQKPTITAPVAVTVSSDAGKCTASGVTLGTPVTADNCSVASVSNNSTEPFALGNTTVTWTVTDGSGNTQTATQVVTVTDNQKPTITAPAAVSVSSDEGKCTASGVVLGTPVTADNCSIASVTNNAAEPFALGNTTVTWTVTDGSGNIETATQVVTVTDNQKPTITAPAAVSVSSDEGKCTASGVTLGSPVTGDNCSVASVTSDAVQPFALGNTTVTWTVTDGSGNTQTATQVVTVTDSQKPTITAPVAVTVSSDAGKCTASGVTLGTPVTADNCSVASVSNNSTEPFALGNTTVTWTVTDGSGNTQTATQVVTVTDNQKPTITAPAAVSVSSDEGKCTASGVVLGTPVTADNCSIASVTNNAAEPFALGNTTVTWTVTDGSGNIETATQVVTITDNQKPTITAPAAVTVSSDAGKCTATGVVLGTPVTADNCSVASVSNNSTEPFALGNTTVTWTVTDGSGNTEIATQLITVTDNQKPTITAPAAVSVSSDAGKCTATGVVLGTPVTADNCSVATVTNNATQPFALGNTTVTWTVTDGSGNTQTATQVVTVTDNQKPTITAPGAVTVSSDEGKCSATGVVLGTPVRADNCAVASVTNNATEPFASGNTNVMWTVTDASGNTQTATQLVTVTDNQKPTITAPVAVTVSSDAGKCNASGVVLGTPVSADNCSVASVTNNAVEPFALGNTTVTWTVTDGSGNTQTATQLVTVTDNQNPTIIAPTAISVSADTGKSIASGVTLGTPITSDNCAVASVTNNAPQTFALGSTTVTWTVTDASGNSATATQVVTVTDPQSPVFTQCLSGNNQTVNTGIGSTTYVNQGVNWNAVAADNDIMISLLYTLSGATTGSGTSLNNVTFNMGVTTITWLATDKSGNVSACIFNVTVVDNEKPAFIKCLVGSDIVLKSATDVSNHGVMIIGTEMNATASDNDRVVSLTYTLSGATTGAGTSLNNVRLNAGETTVTWTAVDNSGNTSICQFNVTVLDSNLPPTAVDDQFTVTSGTQLTGDVRLNDSDLTEPINMLNVTLKDPARFGKLSLNQNGTFTYMPDPEFVGTDHFTYELCKTSNSSLCSQAGVTITVVRNTDCTFFVPNGFSPDGDGINDNFKIKCISNYPNAFLRIFTRSGIKVYEKKHYGNIDFWGSETDAWWNGQTDNKLNVGGRVLSTGTYIYILELEEGNKNKVLTGAVFLSK